MTDFGFMFKSPPALSWHGGARYFGAPRDGGKRKHGGCDVIKPPYEQMYAVADGVLVHEEKYFYLDTWYVTYQHGPFLCRYGEILHGSTNGAKIGHKIKRGDPIAKVGLMSLKEGSKAHYDPKGAKGHMLHFEMYSKGNDHSTLRSAKGPYQRRADIIDPAPYLDDWVKRLP